VRKSEGNHGKTLLLKYGVNEKKNFPVGSGPARQIMLSTLFVQKNELIEPRRFIPTIDFVSAIKTKDYPVYKAKNLGVEYDLQNNSERRDAF